MKKFFGIVGIIVALVLFACLYSYGCNYLVESGQRNRRELLSKTVELRRVQEITAQRTLLFGEIRTYKFWFTDSVTQKMSMQEFDLSDWKVESIVDVPPGQDIWARGRYKAEISKAGFIGPIHGILEVHVRSAKDLPR